MTLFINIIIKNFFSQSKHSVSDSNLKQGKLFSHKPVHNLGSIYKCMLLTTALLESMGWGIRQSKLHFTTYPPSSLSNNLHLTWQPFQLLSNSDLQIKDRNSKLIFLFHYQNPCCGYSKEPSHRDGSFEHPLHRFKWIGKKIITTLRSKSSLDLDLCN